MTTTIFLCGAVLTLLGWIFGPRIADALARGRDRETRKRNFRAAISSVRDIFKTTPDKGLEEAHRASISRVREECARILEDIPQGRRAAFQTASNAYLCLTWQEIQSADESKKKPFTQAPAQYALGRAKLRQLLDKLTECAK